MPLGRIRVRETCLPSGGGTSVGPNVGARWRPWRTPSVVARVHEWRLAPTAGGAGGSTQGHVCPRLRAFSRCAASQCRRSAHDAAHKSPREHSCICLATHETGNHNPRYSSNGAASPRKQLLIPPSLSPPPGRAPFLFPPDTGRRCRGWRQASRGCHSCRRTSHGGSRGTGACVPRGASQSRAGTTHAGSADALAVKGEDPRKPVS